MKQIAINLLGGPGSGKSTIALELTAYLKKLGVNCELISEFVKQKVYEGNQVAIDDQLYIFANQKYNMRVTRKEVQVLICDSPLYLTPYYNQRLIDNGKETPSQNVIIPLVKEEVKAFDNMNYFVWRNHPYVPIGRYQTEEEADADAQKMYKLMQDMNVEMQELKSTDPCMQIIACDLMEKLRKLDKDAFKQNNLEIERRFIVDYKPEVIKDPVKIKQGYLQVGNKEKRVRSIDDKKFYLTEKQGKGLERIEKEQEIDKVIFDILFKECKYGIIKKTRGFYSLGMINKQPCVAELNIFEGALQGLMLAEVEFASKQDAVDFQPPAWFGKEVTNDERFLNKNLASLKDTKSLFESSAS